MNFPLMADQSLSPLPPVTSSSAEIGVKTVKWPICNNTGPGGTLDTDAFQRVMLQYRLPGQRDQAIPSYVRVRETHKRFHPHPPRPLPPTRYMEGDSICTGGGLT